MRLGVHLRTTSSYDDLIDGSRLRKRCNVGFALGMLTQREKTRPSSVAHIPAGLSPTSATSSFLTRNSMHELVNTGLPARHHPVRESL